MTDTDFVTGAKTVVEGLAGGALTMHVAAMLATAGGQGVETTLGDLRCPPTRPGASPEDDADSMVGAIKQLREALDAFEKAARTSRHNS